MPPGDVGLSGASAPTVERVEQPKTSAVGPLFHIYRRWPAEPGDRALCGYVKQGSCRETRYGDHPDLCVVCDEIYESQGATR